MTELILPNPITKAKKEKEKVASMLPTPAGYRILCAVPEVEEKTEGGVYKADETKHYEELLTPVLFVLELGPDAYADKSKFPTGPWCKKGDFILVRPNAGTKVLIFNKEFRILNDDSVEAVVADPRGIKRSR